MPVIKLWSSCEY